MLVKILTNQDFIKGGIVAFGCGFLVAWKRDPFIASAVSAGLLAVGYFLSHAAGIIAEALRENRTF